MIRVKRQPEPADFDTRVRTPGRAFLSAIGHPPTNQDFRRHAYWSRAHKHLSTLYRGICAYSASWTPKASANGRGTNSSVDHYIPKCVDPQLAYEWHNFRLARIFVNEKKGDSMEIVDPMEIEDDCFSLNFKSLKIVASKKEQDGQLSATLRLINDRRLIEERSRVLLKYLKNEINMNFICQKFPFFARELQRQSFDEKIAPKLVSTLTRAGFLN